MKTYSLEISAAGLGSNEAAFADRFLNIGHSDTAILFQDGAVVFQFERRAGSFAEALSSAMADIDAADPAVAE